MPTTLLQSPQRFPGNGGSAPATPLAARSAVSEPRKDGGISRTAWRDAERPESATSSSLTWVRRSKSQGGLPLEVSGDHAKFARRPRSQGSLRPEVRRAESGLEKAYFLCQNFELNGIASQEIPYRGIRGMDFWYHRFARPASREQYSREPIVPSSCQVSAGLRPSSRPTSPSSLLHQQTLEAREPTTPFSPPASPPASPSSPAVKNGTPKGKDGKRRGKEKELSAEEKALVGRILDVLRNHTFFRDLEASSPGVLVQVAKQSKMSEEVAGQVLFRQGDSPVACYVLASGQVETRIFKSESSPGHQSGSALSRFQKTARHASLLAKTSSAFTEALDRPTSPTVASPSTGSRPTPRTAHKPKEFFTLSDARSRNQGMVDKNGKPARFKTCDGGSTFTAESTLGDQLNVLHPGAIAGDGALHDGIGIQTTIRCIVDCEFVVIPGETYRRVIKPRMTKHAHINEHVPGAKEEYAGFLDIHPACFFREDTYPEGHGFLFEGINAEPSIFVVGPGSRVDFRRYRRPDENPAYILATRPMSAPTSEIGSKSSLAGQLGRTAGSHQSAPELLVDSTESLPGGSGMLAFAHQGDVRWQDGCDASRAEGGDMGTYESLGEGGIFCSLSALPVSADEPFTAVAAHPNCKVYSIIGADLQRLFPQFLRGLRGQLIKMIIGRFHKFMEEHPNAFVPPRPAPQSRIFQCRLREDKPKYDMRASLFARAEKLEEEKKRTARDKRRKEYLRMVGQDHGQLARTKRPAWMKAHEKAAERAKTTAK